VVSALAGQPLQFVPIIVLTDDVLADCVSLMFLN